jgi:hypothetical protein
MIEVRKVLFRTGDNRECRLFNIRETNWSVKDEKGPVLMVAGVGVRANVFRPPGQRTLVDCLLERGYDVWLEDWRACIEWGASPSPWTHGSTDYVDCGPIPLNELDTPPPWPQDQTADKTGEDVLWCLDHAALYDHPHAVKTVVKITHHKQIKAVIHCIGSVTFMMAAVTGLVPQVTTIVSNAVSLHPVVPWGTFIKGWIARPIINQFVKYLDAQWGSTEPPPNRTAKLVVWLMNWFHFECLNQVCKTASFSYGVGLPKLPVLWRHENLRPEIHNWIKVEFGKVLMRVFEQLQQALKVGHIIRLAELPQLPADYTADAPNIGDTRISFFSGELNACFLKQSQERSFDFFNRQHRRDYHSLHIVPGYGHLDMFIGKQSARDVFPLMLAELEK